MTFRTRLGMFVLWVFAILGVAVVLIGKPL